MLSVIPFQNTFGIQEDVKTQKLLDSLSKKEPQSTINQVSIPDTLNLNFGSAIKFQNNSEQNDRTALYVAIAIALISALVHLLVAYFHRRTASENTDNQIASSKENLILQLKSDKELRLTEFNTNLKIQFQQHQLNNVVENVTDFLSHVLKLNPNNKLDFDKLEEAFDGIYSSKLKIELLLDTNEKHHENLLNSLEDLLQLIELEESSEQHQMEWQHAKNKCIDDARTLILSINKEISQIKIN